jgi:NtrC-family two-component system sensor histidine kinase KinB
VKLRSRLFLNSSALITVALLGLLLGMFSVLQLTKAQNQAMTHSLSILDATLGLRLELSKQLILLLPENLDHQALQASDRRFNDWLEQTREGALDERDRQAAREITRAYAR